MSEIASFPSNRLQPKNPRDLESFYDMLRVYGNAFVRASSQIAQLTEQVRNGNSPLETSWGHLADSINDLRAQCEVLDMPATLAQMQRVEYTFNTRPFHMQAFIASLIEINSRMNDELAAKTIYCIESSRTLFLANNQFAISIGERFPDAIADMDEAARCYAFERPTACIFHLMRVTEYGINAIAAMINIGDHNPTWDPIIRKIDSELKLDYSKRQYKGSQDLLANMSTHLHAVKMAWRNKTMHVEKINTMEHAKEIYDATCGLMRYLSENLPRKEKGILQAISEKLGVRNV